MKPFLVVLLSLFVVMAKSITFAQSVNIKVSRDARKEAKILRRQNFQTSFGNLTLEEQLYQSYLMQYELDENDSPKYIMSSAQSIDENYDSAKMAAINIALADLAGQIQTDVVTVIETTLSNRKLSIVDAASVSESILIGKDFIYQRLGRTIMVVECYRILPDKTYEVLVRIAYNMDEMKAMAEDAIGYILEQKDEDFKK